MPSPIAHVATGALLSRLAPPSELGSRYLGGGISVRLALAMALSLLPDLDAAVGIALGNLGRYHNNFAGSPLFGLLVACAVGLLCLLVARRWARELFLLTLVCYELHVLMDYFTVGRGLMMAWPFSSERFAPPFPFFFGVRWSHGLVSASHLTTVASELGYVLLLLLITRWRGRR